MLTSSVWGFSASVPICDTASSFITKSLKQVNIVNEHMLSLNSCQNQVHLYTQKRLIKRHKKKSLNQPWQTQVAQCEWILTPWFCQWMFDSPSCPGLAVDLEQTERKKLPGSFWNPDEEFRLAVFVFSVSFWLCIPEIIYHKHCKNLSQLRANLKVIWILRTTIKILSFHGKI